MTRKSKKIKYTSDEELLDSDEDEETIPQITYNDHFDNIYDLYIKLQNYCGDLILPLLDQTNGADFYQFMIKYSIIPIENQ